MKIPANVIDQLITGAQSDIRQVLNMLSTWRLSSDTMDFDQSKSLLAIFFNSTYRALRWPLFYSRAKMNEKYSIMSPFDITSKILGPYLFSSTARESLGDKMELYFQDHSFMPLFIQVWFSPSCTEPAYHSRAGKLPEDSTGEATKPRRT